MDFHDETKSGGIWGFDPHPGKCRWTNSIFRMHSTRQRDACFPSLLPVTAEDFYFPAIARGIDRRDYLGAAAPKGRLLCSWICVKKQKRFHEACPRGVNMFPCTPGTYSPRQQDECAGSVCPWNLRDHEAGGHEVGLKNTKKIPRNTRRRSEGHEKGRIP